MNYNSLIIAVLLLPVFALTDCKTKNDKSKPGVYSIPVQGDSILNKQTISIHEAALTGQVSVVLDLIARGTDINSPDPDGRTALMYAAFNGHTETTKLLLEKGASVNLCDSNGRTALMMASSGPYREAVKLLLDHNADPNITDKEEHFTALMFAAAEGQLDVVKVLISYRADPFLKDIDGDEAMIFAANNGYKEVADLLKSLKK